jgi:FixJ family two-component response regulator
MRPGMAVVLMSGYPEGTIAATGQPPPGQILLSKPFRRAELARVVRTALVEAGGRAAAESEAAAQRP